MYVFIQGERASQEARQSGIVNFRVIHRMQRLTPIGSEPHFDGEFPTFRYQVPGDPNGRASAYRWPSNLGRS